MSRFLLFPILFWGIGLSSVASSQTTPPFYGVYALRDGQFVELQGRSVQQQALDNMIIEAPPTVRFPDGKVQFVLYRRDYANAAPNTVFVHIVAQIGKEVRPGSVIFGPGTSKSVTGTWYVRNRGYEFRVAPFGNNREMILVRSASDSFVLPNGRYALAIDGRVFDFLVNKESSDPEHCVDRVFDDTRMLSKFVQCEPAQSFIEKGNAALSAKDYDRAIADYSEAIRLEPENLNAYLSRCFARAVVGRELQQALDDCNKALESDSGRELLRQGAVNDFRALVYLRLGSYGAAVDASNAALNVNPKSAFALYCRGTAKRRAGDISGGDEDIATARAIQPNIVEEWSRFGIGK